MPSIVYIDILVAVMMMVLFVLCGLLTNGYIRPYFIVPAVLVWTHVMGNALQEMEVGPDWVQNHLHDVGVATFGLALMMPAVSLASDVRPQGLTRILMKYTMVAHFLATIICVLCKVYRVTINREAMIAKGYSGDLDIGDITAFVVGFIIMATNHFVMKGRIISKMRDA